MYIFTGNIKLLWNTQYFQTFVISIFEYTIFIYLNVFINPKKWLVILQTELRLVDAILIKTNLKLKSKSHKFYLIHSKYECITHQAYWSLRLKHIFKPYTEYSKTRLV